MLYVQYHLQALHHRTGNTANDIHLHVSPIDSVFHHVDGRPITTNEHLDVSRMDEDEYDFVGEQLVELAILVDG